MAGGEEARTDWPQARERNSELFGTRAAQFIAEIGQVQRNRQSLIRRHAPSSLDLLGRRRRSGETVGCRSYMSTRLPRPL